MRGRNQLLLTKFIDKRSTFLPASDLVDEAALDPYAFMRDAYLQRRSHQVHDGNGPQNNPAEDDDFYSLDEESSAAEAQSQQAEAQLAEAQ